jgi:WD40 repeat protein
MLLSQAIETDFGKNRVQYHDDFKYWSKYETRNFITYWYGKSSNVGKIAAQMAEYDHNEIRKTIEHKINDKIEIIVYTDISDLKQSNLGSEDAFVSKSGETKIVGNKMFVYFDGNHHHLRKQVREGIASVYFSAMMFGANFQEIIQNAVLLEVPDWFAQGIVTFAASGWNIFIEDELRDILYRDKDYYEFKKLAEDHPRVAGHALWYYISQNYGKSAISNLLYLTRISRDIENAFEFVLNTPIKQIYNESDNFYKQKYKLEEGKFDLQQSKKKLKLKNKKFVPISNISLSPDGKTLAYAQNQQSKMKIYLYDIKSKKSSRIFKKGFKNAFQATDYNYPNITWSPNSNEISFTYLNRDVTYLRRYNIAKGKYIDQVIPEIVQRIYSLSYLDERYYIMSASIDGFSDLFLYDTQERQQFKITDDIYDDIEASYVNLNGEEGILWSSNRPDDHILPVKLDTILPIGNFDIFFIPFKDIRNKKGIENMSRLVERITATEDENERHPIISGGELIYLNDKHGVINSFVFDQKSSKSYAINNYGRNMIRHTSNKAGDAYYMTFYNNGGYEVHKVTKDYKNAVKPYTTDLKKQFLIDIPSEEADETKEKDEFSEGMKFVTEFDDPDPLPPIEDDVINQPKFLSYLSLDQDDHKEGKVISINSNRILAAGLRFKLANITTRLDNDVLFGGLELYEGQNQQVNQLPMGLLAKATIDDLFEDYSFEGGVRFPTSFNGSEYFVFFDNKKKLLDKRFGLYRRALTENVNSTQAPFTKSKKETILGMYQVSYPFDIYSSVRATSSLRLDRAYFKITNDQTLDAPIGRDKRLGLKVEYIFDNSLDFNTNIKHGTRAKAFVEMYNQFDLNVIDGFDLDPSNGFTTIIGFDARHYIPLLRESVFALRSAGATSIGTKRNVYYLGDVNNTISPSFNQSIPVPQDESFAFKSNVNHLRGFSSNARNGSTFLIGNAELRIPIFRYLLDKNQGATFFKDFHVIAFADAGLAWYGASPYSDKNPLNSVFVDGPIAQLEVQYFRDPLVVGYGMGIRTTLLGYFLRLDYAIGIETRRKQDPKWHFSFGYDF